MSNSLAAAVLGVFALAPAYADEMMKCIDRAKHWVAGSLIIDPDDRNTQYNAACTCPLLGEVDQAIDILESGFPKVGPEPKRWFKNDTDLVSIRNHPRSQRSCSNSPNNFRALSRAETGLALDLAA
jgi:hypothetical protein